MTIREWMRMVQAHVSHVERFDLEVLLGVRLDMGRASLLAHLDDEISETMMEQLAEDEAALAAHTHCNMCWGRPIFAMRSFM